MLGSNAWPCFETQEQWDEWHRQAIRVEESPPAHPCTDCTPEYRDRMAAKGQCRFDKVIRFEYDTDHMVVGLLPTEELALGNHIDGRKSVLVRRIK